MDSLSLHNLKASSGAKKRKRRLGRGNASGKGNYSGKGMKGQRARSGGRSGLGLKGIKGYLQRIPKTGGFTSKRTRPQIVGLRALEREFKEEEIVTPKLLFKKGLIKNTFGGVKILGTGTLKKKLTVKANAFSKGAKDAIIKAGGQIEIISKDGVTDNEPSPTKLGTGK